MAAAHAPLASALSQPIRLTFPENSPKRSKSTRSGSRLELNALAHDYATTLSKLMELETTLESKVKEAVESKDDISKIERLRSRLYVVQDQIDSAERPRLNDSGDEKENKDEEYVKAQWIVGIVAAALPWTNLEFNVCWQVTLIKV
jgi:hypothetical protein